MGAGMKLYWRPMWGTDEDIRAAVGNGELLLSEPRLERVLDQAYERGIKAKRVEHERAGELLFGAGHSAMRRRSSRSPTARSMASPPSKPSPSVEPKAKRPQQNGAKTVESDLDLRASVMRELELRLADIQSIVASVHVDEDTGEMREDPGGLLSAFDYALRGDPGCVEPSEWHDRRVAALREHAEYLDLGRCSDDPTTERLLARIRQLEEALREAADDLDKAANQFEGLKGPDALPVDRNPEIFASKAARVRAALNPDLPNPGTSDSQDTFD